MARPQSTARRSRIPRARPYRRMRREKWPAMFSSRQHQRRSAIQARGCEELPEDQWRWVHLRICRTCGHVGCCDDSPNRHATKHFHATQHPIIEGYMTRRAGWCYVDEVFLDLGKNVTPSCGAIPPLRRALPRPGCAARREHRGRNCPGIRAFHRCRPNGMYSGIGSEQKLRHSSTKRGPINPLAPASPPVRPAGPGNLTLRPAERC